MTAAPALVIFDCDGVLVDSERMEVDTLAEALTWLDLDDAEPPDAAELHDRNRGGKLADLLTLVEATTGRPVPDGFEARYRQLQLARLRSVEPVPGAHAAVAAAAGLPRCVVSGGPMQKMEVSLVATGLWDSFAPDIFSCYDLGDHKPSPGIYLHALARFDAAPGRCLAIEDSPNGVAAAAAAGVPVVGLARDTDPVALAAAGAGRTVASMHEFADLLATRRHRSGAPG
jgi:beta-phosphoglucomutase-like phosphatase (HAD superfamily)